MGQFPIRFPQSCCWCGTRVPVETKDVHLSKSSRGQRVNVRFKAPICQECRDYSTALDKVIGRYALTLYGISVVLTMLLTAPLLFADGFDGENLVMWPLIGLGVGLLVALVLGILLSVLGVDRRVKLRQVGEPPAGYASETGSPATLTGSQTMRFYNEDYQRLFATVNPDLVREEDR